MQFLKIFSLTILVSLLLSCGDLSPTPAPDTPVATTGDGQVTLSWNQMLEADTYNIYYSSSPITQLSSANKLSTNALSQQITGLTNGTKYYFVVTTVKTINNIESEQSIQIEAMPMPKPALANLSPLSFYHGDPATITFTNTGGTASNCTATPTLPAGLNIATHSGTCRITGTTTGLTTATTYTIKATNTTGFHSATINIKVILKAPVATIVTNDKKITLTWNSISGADKYNIYYSSNPITQLSSASKLSTSALNQQITGLTNGTKYYFVVTAVKTQTTGDIENQQPPQIVATPASKPVLANLPVLSFYHGDPATITFTNTGGTANNCTATPTLPTGLNIAVHSGTCRIAGTTTGLTAATTYTIKATNTTGFNTATVNIKVILKAPIATVVTDDKKITLAWNSISGADKYNIYYSNNPITQLSSASKLSTNALNQQITGLTNDTKYYFVITAVKTTGNIESQQSIQIEATPVSKPVLANLSPLSFYHGDPVTITFTNTGGTASNCTAPTLPAGLNIAVHSDTCQITGTTTGLTTATTYTIKATNTTGFNTATVNIKVILKAPVATVVTDDKKITLAWNSISGADKYNIYYSSNPITQLSSASKLSINALNQQITGLTNNTKYYFIVTAVKTKTTGNIESQQSIQLEATPVSKPALANLSALSFYHGDPATITFTNTGGIASNCTATPTLPAGLSIAVHSGTCRITGTTTGLITATTYTIKATNTTGFNTATVNIKVILKAPVATIVTDDKKVTLAWNSVSGADKYNIYYSSSPITQLSSASKLSTNTLNKQITGLTNNIKYYFVVTAVKTKTTGNIESQQSTQLEATPVSKPALANLSPLSFYHGDPATITFTNAGGTASNCTATPPLPIGLNIAVHSGTCRITGTTTDLTTAANYTIKATNTTGFNSATVNIKVILKAPVVTIVTGNQKVILSWDSVSGADKYNIYYAEQTFANIDLSNYASLTGGTLILDLTGNSKEIALTNGTKYYFVITASKDDKESDASSEVSAISKLITLNDTGITFGGNYPTGNNTNCTGTTITAQDCKHGRDAKAAANTLAKIGAGSAGFDFTKLDSNGNTLAASATDWRCVKDNHTGLIWEVKTTSGLHNKNDKYNWYNTDSTTNGGSVGYANDDGNTCYGYNSSDSNTFCNTQAFVNRVNTAGLCGKNDWRLPDRNELRSIVDYGRYSPSIDIGYFPNTPADNFWSSSPHSNNSDYAWIIDFDNGYGGYNYRFNSSRLRLVRSGQ